MIRVLSLLLLVTAVFARTEYCDEETRFSTFTGVGEEGQTIDEYCECIYKYLEEQGHFRNGTAFDCKEISELAKLDWKTSPYEEESGCTNCLHECEEANGDRDQICEFIRNPKPEEEIAARNRIQRSVARAFLRIRFWVCVVFGPGYIAVGVGLSIEW